MEDNGLEDFCCFERVKCDREELFERWKSLAQNDRSRLLDSIRGIQKSADQCTTTENELEDDRAYIEDVITRESVKGSQVEDVNKYDSRLKNYAYTLALLLSRREALASLYVTCKVPAVCVLAAKDDIKRIKQRIVALATRRDATSKFLNFYYMDDIGPGTGVPSASVGSDKWRFRMNFTEGGQSQPQLWTREDENGKILDRIVKKEEVLSAWKYRKANLKWYPKAKDFDTREPMEFFTQNGCWDRNKDAFVHARTWTGHEPLEPDGDDKYLVTLYLQFCPYGDLRGLIDRLSAQGDQVAEPILWRVLDILTDACITMQRGGTLENDLKQIVHLDIKAANVFLDSPSETYFPRYPKPLLGDFGLAIYTHAQEAENPSDYKGTGTSGLKAPEMVQNVKFDDKRLRKILAHTNIYQVGLTMLELIRTKPFLANEQLKFDTPEQRTPEELLTHPLYKERYSPALLKAIDACVRFEPNKRVPAEKLKDGVAKHTKKVKGPNKTDEELSTYLTDAMVGKQEEVSRFKWPLERDKYALNMAHAEAELPSETASDEAEADEPKEEEGNTRLKKRNLEGTSSVAEKRQMVDAPAS